MCLCLSETQGASKVQREESTSAPLGPAPPPPPQQYGSLTCGALALEGVDLVDTLAVV